MSSLSIAEQTAIAHIDEILANVRIRQSFTDIVVKHAAYLYGAYGDAKLSAALEKTLKDRDADPSPMFRGLIIQLNAVFEGFIRALVGAALDEKRAAARVYGDLDEEVRREHIHRSATILTNAKAGHLKGLHYDFATLQANLGACLTNAEGFSLNNEIFTLLMGNCTPTKIDGLFQDIGLSSPFGDALGDDAGLKTWANQKAKRQVVKRAREELEQQLALRNDIAHGNITKPITQTELIASAQFFRALIHALAKQAA
jgi:hypothetical protein